MREKSTVESVNVPDRPKSSDLQGLKSLLPYFSHYKFQVFLSFISIIAASMAVLLAGQGIKNFIDQGFLTNTTETLQYTILWLLGCVIALAFASFGRSYYVSWLGERIIADIRQKIFRHLLTLEVGYYESIRPGELISRLTADTSLIQILIGTSLAVGVRNLLMFLGGLALMIMTSPQLSLLTTLIVPAVIVPILVFGRHVKQLSRSAQDSLGRLSATLEETMSGIRNCYAFNRQFTENKEFHALSEHSFSSSILRLRMRSWLSLTVMILVFSGICALLWIGGTQVIEGELSAGELSSFIFYAVLVASTIGSFSEIYADLQRAAGASERIFEILNTKAQIKSPVKPRLLPTPARGVIAFHNVNFSYPNDPKRKILQDLTLSINPGEKVAIVGPSGSGKSTILSLLLRFFDPQSGSIYVDGVDTQSVNVDDLRMRFGIVPQDPTIFSQSIYDNILYARPEASETEVWHAIEAAYLGDFIQSLPNGVHTQVGTKGVRLSGGQKQRLAIARVILRNAPILLLDEATSALDAESERYIQQSIKSLMAQRTTVVVAHRLATVLKADKIVVLNNGHVEAVGTHAELISEDGLYRRLAMLQFTDSLKINNKKLKETNALWA